MESQPQNPEVRSNPENSHPCSKDKVLRHAITQAKLDMETWAQNYNAN